MLFNYIIVDSNPLDRLHLSQTLKRVGDLSFSAEFSNAVEALSFLNYNTVDVIFLASNLPVYSGFEFIEQLNDKINIILISKNPNDAFTAFEYGLLDCLKAPFNVMRIEKSMERLKSKIETEKIIQQNEDHFLVIKHNLKNQKIGLNDIHYIEATGDYVKIITLKKNYVILSTMKRIMDRLPKNQFLRVHKSYIVNIKKVSHYTTKTLMVSGKEIPLSRNHKKEFRHSYEKI